MKQRHPKTQRALRALFMCACLLVSSLSLAFMGTANAGFTAQNPPRASSPNGLVINEAFDSQTPANEYFELYNTGGSSINLSTYVIYNRDGQTPLSGLANPNINPGEFRSIGPTQLGTATIGGPTGLSQNDFLGLVNTSPSDATIDVVNWGGAPNPNWLNYERFRIYFFTANIPTMPPPDDVKSLQRYPDGLDTDTGSDFAQIQRSPSSASCADPSEGNTNDNTLAAASTQDVGATTLHRFCLAGDTDYTAVSLSSNITYTIQTTIPAGSQANTILRLFSADGTQVAEDNNPNANTSMIRFRPASSGVYKIQALDANGGGAPGATYLYNLSITSETTSTTPTTTASATVGRCSDPYEPDDSMSTAKSITLNSEQTRTFCKPDGTADTDWLLVSVGGGKVYTFLTKNLADPVDTIIALYDGNGAKLAENDDYQPGQGLASRIDYNFTSTGDYFLRVREKTGSSGPGYQYTVSFASTGTLPSTSTASVTPTLNPNTPTPTPGLCTDSFEPDGVAEAARLLLIGTTQRHSICPATDADFVRFYAKAGKVYTIRTGNLGVGLDTYMYLFDSDGHTILAQNDDGGDGVASRIDFYPQRDDFYFAQVKNAGDLGGPDQTYDLSLAVSPGVPQPPGTATAIIAPPVTVSAGPQPPTVVAPPTRPPVSSPTQGALSPTPASLEGEPSAVVPPPQASAQATVGRQQPPTVQPTSQLAGPPTAPATSKPTQAATQPPAPTSTVPAVPTNTVAPTAEVALVTPTTQVIVVPNVPKTGALGSGDARPPLVIVLPPREPQKAPEVKAVPPTSGGSNLDLSPIFFRVFYDLNRNGQFNAGEGVRGVNVYFVPNNTKSVAYGVLTTSEQGAGKAMLPSSGQRIYIPYLGIYMPLNDFPARAQHSIWLSPVALPTRVP